MKQQRAIVALSHTAEDVQLLAYARLLTERGLLREIRFLHVLPPETDSSNLDSVKESLEASVESNIGAIERRTAFVHVERGDRLDTTIECAQKWRSDVIVLGHRRSRSGQRSLARRLAMISPCSVWMVPEGAPIRLTSIIAPVDFSDHAADGLVTAMNVGSAMNAEECIALHVDFDESLDISDEHREAYRLRQREKFQDFLRGIDTDGVPFDWIWRESPHPARVILEEAAKREADLIVMNTRGRSRAASVLLGSVTTEVIVNTTIPILVVKHFGAKMDLFTALREGQTWNRRNPKTN